MVRKHAPARGPKIAQGGLAVMLCEAILHVLLERRVLEKDMAIEVIDSIADIVAELATADARNMHATRESLTAAECSAILNSMRLSLQAHD
jgi:hypothetical protein